MVSIRTAAPALLLLLAGCVSGPDHKPPEMPLAAKFSEGGTKVNGDVSSSQWWTAFGDRKLNALAEQGLSLKNLNIQQSLERINQAQGQVVTAGAGGLPSLFASGSQTTSGQMGNLRTNRETQNTTGSDITASWLLDLWGPIPPRKGKCQRIARCGLLNRRRLSPGLPAGSGQQLCQRPLLPGPHLDCAGQPEVTPRDACVDPVPARCRRRLAPRRRPGRRSGRLDAFEIPGLEISYRRAHAPLSQPCSPVPSQTILAQLQSGGPQPVFRGRVNTGVPADLIRNRPDIRVAERNLAAATAQIGVAEAQLFPTITLSGAISPSYVHTSSAHGGLTSWSFGPALSLPIFDGGTLRANVKIAEILEPRTIYRLEADRAVWCRTGRKRPVGRQPRCPDHRRAARVERSSEEALSLTRRQAIRTAPPRCSTFLMHSAMFRMRRKASPRPSSRPPSTTSL